MGGRGGGSPATREAQDQPAVAQTVPAAPLDQRIRAAWLSLAGDRGLGSWVSLERLRAAFPDVSRQDMDAALLSMFRGSGDVNFVPENNQKTLTLGQRNAALRFGGQDKHLMSIFRT